MILKTHTPIFYGGVLHEVRDGTVAVPDSYINLMSKVVEGDSRIHTWPDPSTPVLDHVGTDRSPGEVGIPLGDVDVVVQLRRQLAEAQRENLALQTAAIESVEENTEHTPDGDEDDED